MTTVVLGLDGAAFELVRPWIDAGDLPTLARLVESGASTDMQSCPPPVTCPNWQCYATGTNPGKLGVYWWERVDSAARRIESTSANDQFDGTHYWRYLDGRSAVINLPTSYPPPSIDGVHIAGGPGAEQSGYTEPASVETELEREFDYTVHPTRLDDLAADKTESPCIEEIYDLIETRFDVLESYVARGEFELVHCTVFYLNVLQHYYWDHEVVERAWQLIDDRLADLLAHENLETLFVMSDHGSNEVETTFYVNTWLEQEGYLQTSSGTSDLLYRLGLTRERVQSLVSRLGVEWWLRRVVPRRIQTMVPDSEGSVKEGAKAGVVDWEASVALASGQGPLYVLEDDPAERERVTEELRSRLDGLEHEGREILSAADPAADVYEGPHLDRAPDLVLRQAPGVHIEGAIGGPEEAFGTPAHWRGENKETGLFLAHGPGIDPGAALPEMHILDIAPTVLHHCGAAVPTDMDGTVRTDLYADDADPATREVTRREPAAHGRGATTDVDGDVSDRLSDLGYLQ